MKRANQGPRWRFGLNVATGRELYWTQSLKLEEVWFAERTECGSSNLKQGLVPKNKREFPETKN
jgi:hypothetical protein